MTTTHTYPYTMVDGHLILDCEGRRLLLDTGAKLSYLDRALIEAFPPAGTREDFFPGLGTFTTDTFDTSVTLGPNTVTITTGALTSIPALALTLVGARGILGSALFDHFTVGYSPRRRRMTIAAFDTSRRYVDGIDTTR
jgi:hypothetical protein